MHEPGNGVGKSIAAGQEKLLIKVNLGDLKPAISTKRVFAGAIIEIRQRLRYVIDLSLSVEGGGGSDSGGVTPGSTARTRSMHTPFPGFAVSARGEASSETVADNRHLIK